MDDKTAKSAPLGQRLELLGPADYKAAIRRMADAIDAPAAVNLESCVRCGLCADSCHYFLDNHELKSIPAYKLNLVIRVFKRYFSAVGRRAPGWTGAANFDESEAREWIDSLFGRCTLCGRCALNCTMGIDIPGLIRKGRGVLASMGLVPDGLDSTVRTALETGNNMGITRQEWVETVAWLEEELQAETGDPEARLPLDRKGANFLYIVNPREPKFYPLTLTAAGKVFHAAGENWTLSSSFFDVTNYAYFSGDDSAAGLIVERLQRAMDELEAKTLVLSECGHGFASNRWEAPEWLSRKLGYTVKSVLQVVAEYVRTDRIRLDPERNPKAVTLHDPCQLVRMGGISEEQRFILQHAVREFVEMTPNRKENYCCGGGGGQLSMTDFTSRRRSAGRIKAGQIERTKAKVVASPCHNCLDQLAELNRHYKLGVEIKSVVELAAEALVLDRKKPA
ncbi:MAG: (Fe-S)-binding protein [Candidatus Aminicenantales bacterium]|jgi:Fe-S oxidoreductase